MMREYIDATMLYVLLIIVVAAAVCVRWVSDGQRLVISQKGKIVDVRGPGLVIIIPFHEKGESLYINSVTATVFPPVRGDTTDGKNISISAKLIYDIVDPAQAVVFPEGHHAGVIAFSRDAMRRMIEQNPLEVISREKEGLNKELKKVINNVTLPTLGIELRSIALLREVIS
jgi:regulator of protease activity HflC (stomatin/prohibitin superfamily)